MAERLKEIPKRLLEWWKKFSIKNRIIIGSAVAAVAVALIILTLVLTRTTMVELIQCDTTAQTAEITSVLEAAGIESKISDDGLRIRVAKEDISRANVELGANGFPAADYDLEKVFSGGFSATESDKEKRYSAYLESKIASDLASMDIVDEARVSLRMPSDDGTIFASEEDASASVTLSLNKEIDDETAAGIAKFIATAVGNENTKNITIMDSGANLLFAGDDLNSNGISQSALTTQAAKQTEQMKKQVKEIFLSQGYDNVTVAPNLKIDTARRVQEETQYSVPDGREEGVLDEEDWYKSNATNAQAGTPGTDSNDDTTYMLNQNGESSSEVDQGSRKYLPNKLQTTTEEAGGSILSEESSIAVVLTSYVYYDEDELKAQGELDNMTFDEFVAQNRGREQVQVADDLIESVSRATGIDAERISILSYEEPFFQKSVGGGIPWSMILTIVILALIVLLLAFVIFRSARPVVVEEVEPEASVEDLLASTRTEPLEDIEYEDKSEASKMINKFVDENPEAVAQLLRNWLNEDWGD